MKFTLNWLKEFLDTNASLDEISHALTSLGLEVEEIIDRSTELKGFIVAEILAADPHPNAEKLRVCKVFDGKEELQIVCGAPNARAGIKVVLAPIGAVVPANGMVIKQSKIRDIQSQGMLCSIAELKLGKDSDGIIELDHSCKVGELYLKEAGLDDPVFDLSITPNRGDCLGVYGIARELAAAGKGTLKKLDESQLPAQEKPCPIAIEIEANSGCKRFTGRYFSSVDNSKAVPQDLSKYLNAIGSKSISTLVDITNLICHAYGRPLHIYDADKIKGSVLVRLAASGEKFMALNDIEYEMEGGETVICDDEGIISLGGIIGGKRSAVDSKTTNAFLEVGLFDPVQIASAGRAHKIDTDSRYRMERKLDEGFLLKADLIASDLILKYAGGKASCNSDVINVEFVPIRVDYSVDYFYRKAGFKLAESELINLLSKLGFVVDKKDSATFSVAVPSFRNDIEMADDITEEVLRVYGYDKIPAISLLNDGAIMKASIGKKISVAKQISRVLAIEGYHELVTWSFMKKEKVSLFADLEDELTLLNPISVDLSYMRPTIIPNLLDALKVNQERGFVDLSVMEIGPVFSGSYPGLQTKVCAGVRSGYVSPKTVHLKAQKFDVFDIKRDLFQLVEEYGFDPSKMILMQDKATPRYYHPAQSAALFMGKNLVAYFGKLNPQILAKYELDMDSYAFELFIEKLPETKTKFGKKAATNFSDFPSVKRDFAFILDQHFPAGNLVRVIEAIDKKLIQRVEIFDSFTSQAVGEDKKSIALNVLIQAHDRTLTEAEIEQISKQVIIEVANKAGGMLRG